jgi:DmsE family decaheme c-type cytochrome
MAAGAAVGCVLLLACCALLVSPPATARAASRQSAVCLDCHEDRHAGLEGTPHHVAADDGEEVRIACTDCHAGDARHWEDDPAEHPMANPAALSATALGELCATCHLGSHQQSLADGHPHGGDEVGCLACHRVHDGTGPGLLKTAEPGLCLGCHGEVRGQFARPYRHPVSDRILACSECHLVTDADPTTFAHRGRDDACFRCHAEFRGPFPYEHQATVDYSVEEGGCASCHDPHGSYLPRLLKQPYEPPHFQLCTQCHLIPPGHLYNANHGTAWSGVSCNECHVDVHGSYTSRLFLTPALESQGCFSPGCHQP